MTADHEPLAEIEEGQHRIIKVDNKLLRKAKAFRSADFDYTNIDKSLAHIIRNYPEISRQKLIELRARWTAVRSGTAPPDSVRRIGEIVHDFKGEGASFGFPLVSSIAETLCLLCESGQLERNTLANVVEAHIAAIEAVLTNDIRGDGGRIGESIVQTLRDSINLLKK